MIAMLNYPPFFFLSAFKSFSLSIFTIRRHWQNLVRRLWYLLLRKEETNSLVNSENWQSKALFGYWCSTIFYALNGNRGRMMTLEGSVKEYLSHIQNRKPAASQIFMSTQFLKRKMTKNILSNWHSNNSYILKNNYI